MFIYLIETKSGKYLSWGEDENRAKINFTIEFTSEKVRKIKIFEGTAAKLDENYLD